MFNRTDGSKSSLSTNPARRKRRKVRTGLIAGAIAAAALIGSQALAQVVKAPPAVSATSVFVVNADTGQVLYAKNENKVFRILSLTKLITAYVLVDHMGDRLSDTVTINTPHLTRGSTAGLKRRDVWTLQDLLYGMVLVSGNDASLAIADYVGRDLLAQDKKRGGSMKRFVTEMRIAAKALGAEKAEFADPYGLSPANVATARDIGLIAARIFTDQRLLPAWACTTRTLHIGGPKARTVTLKTSLGLLSEGSVIGAKTGTHVSKNIYNLVMAWRAPNGQTIVGVVLGSKGHLARYDEMDAIKAALLEDFPTMAEPASGVTPNPDCQ